MYCLVYESTSTVPYQYVQVENILESSRRFNRQHGVTGTLFFYRNRFLQYIEGKEDTIKNLYFDRISHDSRHKALTVMAEGKIANRLFADWDMKFCYLNDFDENLERLLTERNFDSVLEGIININASVEAVKL